jgi:4-oxalocrotonate tautomerase
LFKNKALTIFFKINLNLKIGSTMPFAQIYLMEGRTEDQKRAVIEKVTAALVEAVGAPKENVRVWIQEVPKANWGIAGVSAKDLGR